MEFTLAKKTRRFKVDPNATARTLYSDIQIAKCGVNACIGPGKTNNFLKRPEADLRERRILNFSNVGTCELSFAMRDVFPKAINDATVGINKNSRAS